MPTNLSGPCIKLASVLLCAWMAMAPVMAQTPPPATGNWNTVHLENGTRTLVFKGSANVQGKTVPAELHFFCNSTSGNDVQGALGFDLQVMGVGKLAGFHFDDFEGPDATTIGKPLMRLTVKRNKQAAWSRTTSPAGFYSSDGVFVFGVSAITKQPESTAKSVLKALSDDTAVNLQISIADPRNAKTTLEVSVAVAGKQGEFKTLLAP